MFKMEIVEGENDEPNGKGKQNNNFRILGGRYF
jgi:hypothetical protein